MYKCHEDFKMFILVIIDLFIDNNAISITQCYFSLFFSLHRPVLWHHFPHIWWVRAFSPGNACPSNRGSAGRYWQEASVESQGPKISGDLLTLRRETSHTVQGFHILNSSHPETESFGARCGGTKCHVRALSQQIGGESLAKWLA